MVINKTGDSLLVHLDRMVGGAKEGEEHLEVANHLHLNPSVVPDKSHRYLRIIFNL